MLNLKLYSNFCLSYSILRGVSAACSNSRLTLQATESTVQNAVKALIPPGESQDYYSTISSQIGTMLKMTFKNLPSVGPAFIQTCSLGSWEIIKEHSSVGFREIISPICFDLAPFVMKFLDRHKQWMRSLVETNEPLWISESSQKTDSQETKLPYLEDAFYNSLSSKLKSQTETTLVSHSSLKLTKLILARIAEHCIYPHLLLYIAPCTLFSPIKNSS